MGQLRKTGRVRPKVFMRSQPQRRSELIGCRRRAIRRSQRDIRYWFVPPSRHFPRRAVSPPLGPAPVGEHQRPPAVALELFPSTLRLREAVGDRIDHRRVMAEPAVAAIDLAILARRAVRVETALPGANSV